MGMHKSRSEDSTNSSPPKAATAAEALSASQNNPTVSRVAKACVPCSTKKRRCDGGKPECKVCLVLGTPCTYESRGLKRGPPKGFRSGPKESAKAKLLRTLETTIRDLALQMGHHGAEVEIARISEERGLQIANSSRAAIDPEAQMNLLHGSMKRVKQESPRLTSALATAPTSDAHNSDEDGDMLGINEEGTVRHIGSSSGIHLLQKRPSLQQVTAQAIGSEKEHTVKAGPSRISPRSNQPPIQLPSAHLLRQTASYSDRNPFLRSPDEVDAVQSISASMNNALFHHYWTGFHPFWPILYKPALNEIPSDMLPNTLDASLIYAIYAIAVCVAEPAIDSQLEVELGSGPAGDVLAQLAEHYMFANCATPTPSFASIQCCFLLSCYHQGAGHLSKAYMLSSLANSMAVDLGLHRHLHQYEHDLIERESRSRMIHCIYILHTLLSAEMGRPPMLRAKDIDVPPLDEQEKDENEVDPRTGQKLHSPSVLNISRRLFAIIETVLTQVHSFRRKAALRRMGSEGVRQVVEEIDRTLEAWRTSLPDFMRLPEAPSSWADASIALPSPSFVAVQVWYYTAKILLHRPFIPQDEGISLSELLEDKYHQKCTQAAQTLFDLLSRLAQSSNVDRLSTDLAYIIFTVAVMFVFNARLEFTVTRRDGVDSSFAAALQGKSQESQDVLKRVEKLSSDARRQFGMCKDWLKKLSDRWPSASSHKQLLDGFTVIGEGVVESESHQFTGRRPSLLLTSGLQMDMPRVDGAASSNTQQQQAGSDPLNQNGISQTGQYPGMASMVNDAPKTLNMPTYASSETVSLPTAQQQSLNAYFDYPPNIFDMENVYWNETVARMTPSFGGYVARSSPHQSPYMTERVGPRTGRTNADSMPKSSTSFTGTLPYTPRTLNAISAIQNSFAQQPDPQSQDSNNTLGATSMAPPLSGTNQSRARRQTNFESFAGKDEMGKRLVSAYAGSPALQMLAQQATAAASSSQSDGMHSQHEQNPSGGIGKSVDQSHFTASNSDTHFQPTMSPFTFHQEPSAPEWQDVISMLQLPPAFIQ